MGVQMSVEEEQRDNSESNGTYLLPDGYVLLGDGAVLNPDLLTEAITSAESDEEIYAGHYHIPVFELETEHAADMTKVIRMEKANGSSPSIRRAEEAANRREQSRDDDDQDDAAAHDKENLVEKTSEFPSSPPSNRQQRQGGANVVVAPSHEQVNLQSEAATAPPPPQSTQKSLLVDTPVKNPSRRRISSQLMRISPDGNGKFVLEYEGGEKVDEAAGSETIPINDHANTTDRSPLAVKRTTPSVLQKPLFPKQQVVAMKAAITREPQQQDERFDTSAHNFRELQKRYSQNSSTLSPQNWSKLRGVSATATSTDARTTTQGSLFSLFRKGKTPDQSPLLVADGSGEDENISSSRDTGRQDPADRTTRPKSNRRLTPFMPARPESSSVLPYVMTESSILLDSHQSDDDGKMAGLMWWVGIFLAVLLLSTVIHIVDFVRRWLGIKLS